VTAIEVSVAGLTVSAAVLLVTLPETAVMLLAPTLRPVASPVALIEAKLTEDDGTARDKVARVQRLRTLRDQTGHLFSLAALRGRSVAIVFFDSHCQQECPLEGRELAAAEQSLPAAERPVLVAVSVNPLDTPASAARAAKAWGLASVASWHWLMGTRKQLYPVWAEYQIYVSPRPVNGDIEHTEAVYLVDRHGYMRSGYMYPFVSGYVTSDLRTIATSKGA